MNYKDLSQERKELQELGAIPPFFTTASWQLFRGKYLNEDTPYDQYKRVAKAAAKHTWKPAYFEERFFDVMWKGHLSLATPVLTNLGAPHLGLPVSCGGNYTGDSIDSIFSSLRESAILSKNGFGTSTCLDDVRHRGAQISGGGTSSGTLPVFQQLKEMSMYVSQGNTRRGSIASYLNIEHEDFDEIADYVYSEPDSSNVGWLIKDVFVTKLDAGDKEALRRYQKALKIKMTLGKGYFVFIDKMNDRNPLPIPIKASNLCSEITLPADEDHSFTCVLSSLNLAAYDEWDDDLPYIGTIFLDAVCQEFLEASKNIAGLEKAWAFTKKARALGLGVMGYHTYLLKNRIEWGSLPEMMFNRRVFKEIKEKALEGSQDIAKHFGEPEWMRGTGRANSHLLAIAPTKSTALIMGGVSEGINPVSSYVYTQKTAGGDVQRVDPVLLELMKERKKFNKVTINRIRENMGSVQDEDWLTDEEKAVFKTGFELNQNFLVTSAAHRQPFVCQAQSLNLFFSDEAEEEVVSQVHQEAFKNPDVLSLYYIYSQNGVKASDNRTDECLSCQG